MQNRKMKKSAHNNSAFPGRARAGCILNSAFTLVELLAVIVIMAIIIAISAPAFVGMGRGAGMRGAVSGVRSTLSLLRQWAITHREQVTFYYYQGDFPTASYYYAVNAAGTVIDKTNQLPLEVMFKGNGEIVFKTDGGIPSAISTNIYIRDRKFPDDTSRQKTISINALTGGLRVE